MLLNFLFTQIIHGKQYPCQTHATSVLQVINGSLQLRRELKQSILGVKKVEHLVLLIVHN